MALIKITKALSNKEKRELGIKAKQAFLAEWKDKQLIIADEVPILIIVDGRAIPTLRGEWQTLPKVEVDKGAVPFILKGADVLRPGITAMEPFQKGQAVVVMFSSTPIAVGIALMDSKEAETLQKGKVVKVLHYKGDELWKF